MTRLQKAKFAGSTNKIVADRPAISEETFKADKRIILSKLGATGQTHAVLIAL
jgi:DNA-binding CsgD family transcriptional regulator